MNSSLTGNGYSKFNQNEKLKIWQYSEHTSSVMHSSTATPANKEGVQSINEMTNNLLLSTIDFIFDRSPCYHNVLNRLNARLVLSSDVTKWTDATMIYRKACNIYKADRRIQRCCT